MVTCRLSSYKWECTKYIPADNVSEGVRQYEEIVRTFRIFSVGPRTRPQPLTKISRAVHDSNNLTGKKFISTVAEEI